MSHYSQDAGFRFDGDDRDPPPPRPGPRAFNTPSNQVYNDASHPLPTIQPMSPLQRLTHNYSLSGGNSRSHPAAHPDSAYGRLREQRKSGGFDDQIPAGGIQYMSSDQRHQSPPRTAAGPDTLPYTNTNSHNVAQGVPHTFPDEGEYTKARAAPPYSGVPAAAAAGAVGGAAVGVATSFAQEEMRGRSAGNGSLRGYPPAHGPQFNNDSYNIDNRVDQQSRTYSPAPPAPSDYQGVGSGRPPVREQGPPYAPNGAYGALTDTTGRSTPSQSSSRRLAPQEQNAPFGQQAPNQYPSMGNIYYNGGPYQRQHTSWGPVNPEDINPNDIVDDGDDGFLADPRRKSLLSLNRNSSRNSLAAGGAVGAGAVGAATAAGGGLAGAIAGRMNGQTHGSPNGGPNYDAVPVEKSEWLNQQNTGKKKMKWIVGGVLAFLLVGAIIGGVVGGILGSRKSGSGSSGGQSATDDENANGDLGKNSPEILALMNNKNLHKVFPGMDYTPWGTQYPLCMTYPPSQNNVTRDMAVLSQLTNTVRLYGTDCNQTEMVLHAIDRLGLTNMKIWIGVWVDPLNDTTSNRQLDQMYNIINSRPDKSIFKGVIVGNEVLFRGSNTPTATMQSLTTYIQSVKSNFTTMNLDIPVTTSDLGDNWTAQLAELCDAVLSNVHPFFAGVTASQGANWAITFWDQHDIVLTQGTSKPQVIAEIGWPSAGGNDCGTTAACPNSTDGAVAGIDEMNQFMDVWVCPALANGTDYFWFEAFDEPWKAQFNTPGKDWEDKWGLMDPGRNLKSGLTIPDCGGKTVD